MKHKGKPHFQACLIAAVMILLLCNMTKAEANTLAIIDKPVIWTEARISLMSEYSLLHYGKNITRIEPKAIVVHWTASDTFDSVYWHFYNEARGDGTLNVCSHFVVDRDGAIYRLTPENAMNRHAIGYNWCAIGIENVGGVDGAEDLTLEQLEANIQLIRHLHEKYSTINLNYSRNSFFTKKLRHESLNLIHAA